MSFLGIDVSKQKLDVALITVAGKTLTRKFDNTPAGFNQLQAWLNSLHITTLHACLEATGAYSEAVAEFLFEHRHRVSIVNPLQIKGYAQARLSRQKSDRADARLIADFARTQQPAAWSPLAPEIKELQVLVRRIETLEDLAQMERNRLESVSVAEVRASIARIISTIEAEIQQLERLIKQHFDDHPRLKEQQKLLETIPGIGQKSARLLLSEIEFTKFTSARQAAAQAGLVPHRRQSGTTLNQTKLSKVGNSRVRRALYLPAVVAKNHNKVIREFAERLAKNGKNPLQIVCACMRKLIHLAFGVLKTQTAFDANWAVRA